MPLTKEEREHFLAKTLEFTEKSYWRNPNNKAFIVDLIHRTIETNAEIQDAEAKMYEHIINGTIKRLEVELELSQHFMQMTSKHLDSDTIDGFKSMKDQDGTGGAYGSFFDRIFAGIDMEEEKKEQ